MVMVIVSVGMIVMRGVVRVVIVPVTGLRPGTRDGEAEPAQDAVIVRPDRAGEARIDRPDAGGHALTVLGKGVQQGRGEHVAGHAAERVEVDVHRLPVGPCREGPAQIGRCGPKARLGRRPAPRRIARAAQESCR